MEAIAGVILFIHLAWILWVIFGTLWTQGRPVLVAFHLLSLIWGIAVEVTELPCPLTSLEQFFEGRAGIDPYHGSFVLHYLDAAVYPNVPESLVASCGVAICVLNLAIYVRRYWHSHRI